MAIICVTNLSPESLAAAHVAAAIAGRLQEPLLLLGVAEGDAFLDDGAGALSLTQQRLEEEAVRLEPLARVVRYRLQAGSNADEVLSDEECRRARWIVVAATGWRTSAWRRATVPERLSRYGCAPVLAVRSDTAMTDWARGRRRLLVLVGVDPGSSTTGAAVSFLRELRRVGPCDVLATYVCSPMDERERLGIHSPVHVELLDPGLQDMEALDPMVERVLQREVREQVGDLLGEGSVEVVLEPGFGRPADHLMHVAHTRGADLMVVGTHQRSGVKRLWHGSVSAGVLRHAAQSVVCVPPVVQSRRAGHPPRSVLVPVDFSEASARAISQARTLVGPGGRVHLLHVHRRRLEDRGLVDHYGVLPAPPRERDLLLQRLWELVPRDETSQAVRWSVEGVTGEDVTLAICQATEREGVDLVCVGTSLEPSRLRDALEGEVAHELVARCRRPVMVVPSA